jgi:hypothetical protein
MREAAVGVCTGFLSALKGIRTNSIAEARGFCPNRSI